MEKARPLMVNAGERVQRVWLIDEAGITRSGVVAGGGEGLLPEEALIQHAQRRGVSWVFFGPGEGPLDLLAQTGPFAFHVLRGIETAAVAVDIDVPETGPGAALEGRVRIPEGASPQAVSVVIMRNDFPEIRRFDPFGIRSRTGWASAHAGRDGVFRFEGLVPGRYALGASLVEWGSRTDFYGEVTVRSGETTLSTVLEPPAEGGAIAVRVVDRSERPVAGANLLLLDPVDSPLAASPLMSTHFISDKEGSIVIANLSPGRYGFVVSGGDFPGAPVAGRTLVEAGKQASVKIRIDR
jgi:hypothetical protein